MTKPNPTTLINFSTDITGLTELAIGTASTGAATVSATVQCVILDVAYVANPEKPFGLHKRNNATSAGTASSARSTAKALCADVALACSSDALISYTATSHVNKQTPRIVTAAEQRALANRTQTAQRILYPRAGLTVAALASTVANALATITGAPVTPVTPPTPPTPPTDAPVITDAPVASTPPTDARKAERKARAAERKAASA